MPVYSDCIRMATRYLANNFMHAKPEWVQECLQEATNVPTASTDQEWMKTFQDFVFSSWIESDLKEISTGCLPEAFFAHDEGILYGTFAVQVESCFDTLMSPHYQREEAVAKPVQDTQCGNQSEDEHTNNRAPKSGQQRLLKLTLTDGNRSVDAIEYKPCLMLSRFMPAKVKLMIKGPIDCRRKILLLEPHNITVLGEQNWTGHAEEGTEKNTEEQTNIGSTQQIESGGTYDAHNIPVNMTNQPRHAGMENLEQRMSMENTWLATDTGETYCTRNAHVAVQDQLKDEETENVNQQLSIGNSWRTDRGGVYYAHNLPATMSNQPREEGIDNLEWHMNIGSSRPMYSGEVYHMQNISVSTSNQPRQERIDNSGEQMGIGNTLQAYRGRVHYTHKVPVTISNQPEQEEIDSSGQEMSIGDTWQTDRCGVYYAHSIPATTSNQQSQQLEDDCDFLDINLDNIETELLKSSSQHHLCGTKTLLAPDKVTKSNDQTESSECKRKSVEMKTSPQPTHLSVETHKKLKLCENKSLLDTANTPKLASRNIVSGSPFSYLCQVRENAYSKIVVKACVVTLLDKLCTSNKNWCLSATITDGTKVIDTAFDNYLLEGLFGFSVPEFKALKSKASENNIINSRLEKGMQKLQELLMDGIHLMLIEFPINSLPCVLELRPVNEKTHNELNKRNQLL